MSAVSLVSLALLAGLAAGQPTPAERAIADARRQIAAKPSQADGYNALGLALARRARETADGGFYEQAREAVKKSLDLAPDNFEARKLEVWLLLGQHEFSRALEAAKKLNRRNADDFQVYGFLADAYSELGQYEEAEKAAQWMLDMGRSNVPSLTRAAYLREIFGDIEGAVELMATAYEKIDPVQVEDRAWVVTHLGHLHLLRGQLDAADKVISEALRLFPGYHYSLYQQAKLRALQGRHGEAADLLRQRYRAAPHPENLFDVAVALEKAERREEAGKAFREFEPAALAESEGNDNANRELIFYYIDYAKRPEKALPIALREAKRRRDVYTLEAVAWALHHNGKTAEARREIEAALKVGVRDPRILYRAGVIAAAQNDRSAAHRYLSSSIEANPLSEVARQAKTLLASAN